MLLITGADFINSCGLCFAVLPQHGPNANPRLRGALLQDMVETILLDLLGCNQRLTRHFVGLSGLE